MALAEELASAPWLPTPARTGRDRERGTRAQGVLSYVERLERASGPAQRSDGLQGAKEQHSCVFHSPVYVSTSTTLLKLRHRALSDGGGGHGRKWESLLPGTDQLCDMGQPHVPLWS